MMYGLGVPYESSLPSRLEHYLSQIVLHGLFFVENYGIPGANLFDTSCLVADELKGGRFDLIILSLCNNDASLFEKAIGSSQFPNNVHGYQSWLEFWTNMMPAVRWQIEALRDLSRVTSIPLVLVWLGYRSEDVPLVAFMSALCSELGLPFVDSIEPCVRMFGVDANDELALSSIDIHHFNDRGLDLVARHLALALRRWQVLPDGVVSANVENMPSRLEEAMCAMMLAGKSPLFWARWVLKTVSSKNTILKRARDGRFSAAINDLTDLTGRIRRSLLLWLSESSVGLTADDWDLLHEAACHLAAADELATGASIPIATVAHEELVRRSGSVFSSSRTLNLECFQRNVDILKSVAAAIATIRHDGAFVRTLNVGLDRAMRLARDIQELAYTTLSQSNQIILSAAMSRFGIAVSQLRGTMATLDPGTIRPAVWETNAFSTVQLYVKYPRDEQQKPVFIYVSVLYDKPVSTPARDFIWVECAALPRRYELQFPLVLRGRLQLHLDGQEHCREGLAIVEKIVVLNDVFGAQILWEPDWGKSLMSSTRSREIVMPSFEMPC